jgi:flagellar basal body-associated protein FliL
MNQQIIILAIIIILGLIIGIIAFVIVSKSSKTQKTEKRVIKEESKIIELDELMDIVKNPDSSSRAHLFA